MNLVKRIYYYLLVEPFKWLFYYFFQPATFKRDIEEQHVWQRLLQMLRLQLPMFICYYPFSLVLRIIITLIFPEMYTTSVCYPHCFPGVSNPIITFLLAAADTSWEQIIGSTLGGILFGTPLGVANGLGSGITSGVFSYVTTEAAYGHITSSIFGLLTGVLFGILIGVAESGRKHNRKSIFISGLVSIIIGWFIGTLGGVPFGFVVGFVVGVIQGHTSQHAELAVFLGSALGAITVSFMGTFLKNLVRGSGSNVRAAVEPSRTVGIIFGLILGSAAGNAGFFTATRGLGISGITLTTVFSTEVAVLASISFIVGYLLGYFRFVLYPISGLSTLKAYFASLAHPQYIFRNLHSSALYWDESVILPLPCLKQILLMAIEQGKEQQTLEEINFIVEERSEQQDIAQVALHEICLRDLERRESLRTIAGAAQRLEQLVSLEMRLSDDQWAKPFIRLEDASREATKYYSPIDWREKIDALNSLLANLGRLQTGRAFSSVEMNRRLSTIVHTWQAVTRHELDNLNNISSGLGTISNPYHPGPVLDERDSLFVGRLDLMRQLGEALQRRPRPTFLLNGERRMGKSSLIKQLPAMLGSRYLPIFFDLQTIGATSNAATFLAMIAEEIYEAMTVKGMRIKKLKYEDLQERGRESEAMTYFRFGRWLKQVERQLEQESRVLLLAIDEFEQLEVAGRKNYFDLILLLNWFRSTIQNHPHLALLFSGVKTVGDIGPHWAGYFVNVEVLPVSFLRPEEARKLIIHPASGISHEQLFSVEIVEKIMHVTGCHPFLIQALCSKLIMHLNVEHRVYATLDDVEVATGQVVETWWDTYFQDLWERTDSHQRMCLMTIHKLGQGDVHDIQQKTSLDEPLLSHTLRVLLRRDLLRCERDLYELATPIFSQWVERSKV